MLPASRERRRWQEWCPWVWLPGGGFVVQGVEFDALGRRRAYWLYPVHPGEVAMFRRASFVTPSHAGG